LPTKRNSGAASPVRIVVQKSPRLSGDPMRIASQSHDHGILGVNVSKHSIHGAMLVDIPWSIWVSIQIREKKHCFSWKTTHSVVASIPWGLGPDLNQLQKSCQWKLIGVKWDPIDKQFWPWRSSETTIKPREISHNKPIEHRNASPKSIRKGRLVPHFFVTGFVCWLQPI
jgi:hypothetical protein